MNAKSHEDHPLGLAAHLKSQPIDTKYADWKEPKVSEEGWWTCHVSELSSNNYRLEKIESCAPPIASFKKQLDALRLPAPPTLKKP